MIVKKAVFAAIAASAAAAFAAPLYMDQLEALKFKTVNGRELKGGGDIYVAATNAYRAVADVTEFGAVGDGRTDDTAAIMAARAEAVATGRPLYFPANAHGSTYLTRKGVIVESGMTVTSEPGVTLSSASAVLDGGGSTLRKVLAKAAAKGTNIVYLVDVGGLKVGQEVTLCVTSPGGYSETLADIVAIDEVEKSVEIDTGRFGDGTNKGLLNALPKGSYLLTDFALVKTVLARPCVNATVENLTLKPCGNMGDPYVYTISPIHQTKQQTSQSDFVVRNVTIDGSTHDGISIQGSGDIYVLNCTVKNVKHKGIHWGTSCDKVVVRGNRCLNCGSTEYEAVSNNKGTGAMYFCVNNHRVIIEGNFVKDCYKGVFGFDYRGNGESDYNPVIANNVFDNCTDCGMRLESGYGGTVCGNLFVNFGGKSVPLDISGENIVHTGMCVAGNRFCGFRADFEGAHGVLYAARGRGCVFRGNVLDEGDLVYTNAVNCVFADNSIGGRLVDLGTSENNAIDGNTTAE